MNDTAIEYHRNNLDKSSSPYLVQHKDNPVWWQEWSNDVIKYAVSSEKLLLVSVGYSTCHWCHVMASEAFSDERTAKYLNDNFICIKVDREERPDIDQYMMDFIQRQSGRGGWPLNVFMTPSLQPVFALTYAPAYQKGSMNSFLSVAQQVFAYYQKNRDDIPSFVLEVEMPGVADEDYLIQSLEGFYDRENGGFGKGQKFPSHSTLLYLLYRLAADDDKLIKEICVKTLEEMRLRGLNDHLQGGIFRYCTDAKWTIPHFEKMLYDQAMVIWTYSLAFRVLGNIGYKNMAENVISCLRESFEEDGLFISAHDADTDHEEGATYLWSYEELKAFLTKDELYKLSQVYDISISGNFEGKNHLVKKADKSVADVENKLLSIRRQREQPCRDGKIICGNNALAAIGFIQAGRLLNRRELISEAAVHVKKLIGRFWDGSVLAHSYYRGQLQKNAFLSDAAALFTAVTMLYEENPVWKPEMEIFEKYLLSFKEGEDWIESRAEDFMTINASWFDHPVPSGVSLAEFGLARADLLKGEDIPGKEYRQPYQSDFYNIAAMMSNGLFHVITSEKPVPWDIVPVNSIQLRGGHEQDCYMGTCRSLNDGNYTF